MYYIFQTFMLPHISYHASSIRTWCIDNQRRKLTAGLKVYENYSQEVARHFHVDAPEPMIISNTELLAQCEAPPCWTEDWWIIMNTSAWNMFASDSLRVFVC